MKLILKKRFRLVPNLYGKFWSKNKSHSIEFVLLRIKMKKYEGRTIFDNKVEAIQHIY
jgi:hypothetical protein